MTAFDRKVLMVTLLWLGLLLLMTIYSYSQIDLNLTLSSFGPYQVVQKRLIQLGYYHRSFSATIYGFLLLGLGLLSYLLVRFVQQGKLVGRQLWLVVGLSILAIVPSYPAFSHDIFNYLFNAKLVTHYQLNPYQFKALDFPEDPWTRFMRWTHLPNVYPPVWVVISLPSTFLGFGKFTVSLALIKLLAAGFYLLAAVMIKRLGGETALALWSFNLVIIIESLVSAHNDVVMMALALTAIWFFKKDLPFKGVISALLSFGVKFVGGLITLPFLIKNLDWLTKMRLSLLLSTGLTLVVSWRLGFQPWYFVWPLAIASFFPEKKKITWLLSFLAAATYLPYLYQGDWSGRVEAVRNSFGLLLLIVSPAWFLKSGDPAF